MNDGDFAVTRSVRMRVDVIRHAVGGPTGVADAHGGFRHRIAFDVLHQVGETAGLLTHRHMVHAGRGQRHTGRIISTVFQSLKTLEADLQGFAARGPNISCISYDSTHSSLAYRVRMSMSETKPRVLTNLCHICEIPLPKEIVRTSGARNVAHRRQQKENPTHRTSADA